MWESYEKETFTILQPVEKTASDTESLEVSYVIWQQKDLYTNALK